MRYKKLVLKVKNDLGEEKLQLIDSTKFYRILFYLLMGFLNFLLLAGLVISIIALCTEKEKAEPLQMAGYILMGFFIINGFILFGALVIWHPLIFGFFEKGFLVRPILGKAHTLPLEKKRNSLISLLIMINTTLLQDVILTTRKWIRSLSSDCINTALTIKFFLICRRIIRQ